MTSHEHDYQVMFTQMHGRVGLEYQTSNPPRYPFWCTRCKVITHMTPRQATQSGAAALYDLDNTKLLDI